jgi:hypothetical protein
MKKATLVICLSAVFFAGCNAGCAGKPYKTLATAYSTVNKFATFVEAFDRSVKAYLQAEDERCSAKAKTAGKLDAKKYGDCMRPVLKFSVVWTGEWRGKKTGKGVLPSIQDAQRATRHSLDGAFDYVEKNESACGKKEGAEAEACRKKVAAWRALLKPVLCALVPVVDRGIKLGAFKTTEDPTYKLIRGLAAAMCSK